ncbi:putative HTH-type transcriptional regulator YbaQ [Candidatus Hepatincola sp. Pdp]
MWKYIKTHVGELLKEEFIIPTNRSINAIAKEIHVHPNRLHEIINNKRKITIDTDLRLCKLFGLSDGYFLRIQEHYDIVESKRKLKSELDKIHTINIAHAV